MKFILTKETTQNELENFLTKQQPMYMISPTLLAQLLMQANVLDNKTLSVNEHGALVISED